MVVNELAAGGLHDPPSVGGGVIWLTLAEGDSLNHSKGKEDFV